MSINGALIWRDFSVMALAEISLLDKGSLKKSAMSNDGLYVVGMGALETVVIGGLKVVTIGASDVDDGLYVVGI